MIIESSYRNMRLRAELQVDFDRWVSGLEAAVQIARVSASTTNPPPPPPSRILSISTSQPNTPLSAAPHLRVQPTTPSSALFASFILMAQTPSSAAAQPHSNIGSSSSLPSSSASTPTHSPFVFDLGPPTPGNQGKLLSSIAQFGSKNNGSKSVPITPSANNPESPSARHSSGEWSPVARSSFCINSPPFRQGWLIILWLPLCIMNVMKIRVLRVSVLFQCCPLRRARRTAAVAAIKARPICPCRARQAAITLSHHFLLRPPSRLAIFLRLICLPRWPRSAIPPPPLRPRRRSL